MQTGIFKYAIAATVVCASVAQANYRSSLDDDGCWDALDNYGQTCISSSSEWANSSYSKSRIIQNITNRCPHRVYARFCNQRSNGSDDCGASGIGAGRTHKWATSNATGRYGVRAIGSVQGSKDWVCAGKMNGWRRAFF